jgi:hypothetical protein
VPAPSSKFHAAMSPAPTGDASGAMDAD